MKEASGELNMTLITIVAVGIIGLIFYALWPKIEAAISNQWGETETTSSAQYGSGSSGSGSGTGTIDQNP